MSPFQPVGERARWATIYDLLCKVEVGGVLTYVDMAAALNLDADIDRHTLQLAMRRAAQELEEVDKKVADSVRNIGYRIVEPPEQLGLARRHQRKAGRSLRRGQSKAVNVDFNAVDAETRKAFEIVAAAFAVQMDFNRRLDVRQRNLEKAVEAVTRQTTVQQERTDAELVELRGRLARLEQQRRASTS